MNIAAYVIVGLLTGLLVPSLAIWLFSLSDTEHTHRCIYAADVCNFNRLAIVWQLLATAFATECEIEEEPNRKNLGSIFVENIYFQNLKLGTAPAAPAGDRGHPARSLCRLLNTQPQCTVS